MPSKAEVERRFFLLIPVFLVMYLIPGLLTAAPIYLVIAAFADGITWWPDTRQELYLIGGIAVVYSVWQVLNAPGRLRLAELADEED